MIKRLIFDLDNTLIMWKDEYWDTIKDTLNEFNIDYNDILYNNIIKAMDTYGNEYEYFSRQNMLEHINKLTNYSFDINFLNAVLKKFENCISQPDMNVTSTLEYLNKKYELVILTNWFLDVQEHRLENFGIKHFFSKIFACETFKIKPNKESFITAMENRSPDECVMIGDNFKIDIQGALDVGIKAIYINPNIAKDKKENYIIINKLNELTELF